MDVGPQVSVRDFLRGKASALFIPAVFAPIGVLHKLCDINMGRDNILLNVFFKV